MRRRTRTLAFIAVVGATAAVGFLMTRPAAVGVSGSAGMNALVPGIIHAMRGDIRSVLVLDGAVVAADPLELKSSVDGRVISIAVVSGILVTGSQVAVIDTVAGPVTIRMPEAGLLVSSAVIEGQVVSIGQLLFVVAPERYHVVVSIDPAYLYRLYEPPISIVVQVDRGPAPFNCPFVSLGASSVDGANPLDAPVTLVCEVPAGVRAFSGVRTQVAVTTAAAHDVLLLPVEAVQGSADQGAVTLVRNGAHMRQTVQLGISDGTNVAILDGLSSTDQVLEFPDPASVLSGPNP